MSNWQPASRIIIIINIWSPDQKKNIINTIDSNYQWLTFFTGYHFVVKLFFGILI